MSDQTVLGRMKHAAALLRLAITEYERNDPLGARLHRESVLEELIVAESQEREEQKRVVELPPRYLPAVDFHDSRGTSVDCLFD